MKILILCTGNSCRSQMAHGFLQSFDKNLVVRSGGTEPATQVNPRAVKVMKEIGIDIGHHQPTMVDEYLQEAWDYVITVCDHANETCPYFPSTGEKMHHNFEDPSKFKGSDSDRDAKFMEIRDEIKSYCNQLAQKFKKNG